MEYSLFEKYNFIQNAVIVNCSKNPVEIAVTVMKENYVDMHGPEHHFLDGAAFLTAYRNAGGKINLNKALEELAERTKNMPGAMCGQWGICGSATAVGAALSVIHGTGPLSTDDFYKDHFSFISAVSSRMSDIGGARCCKRNAFLSLSMGAEFVWNNYGVPMEASACICEFSSRNKQCIGARCPFSPLYAEKGSRRLYDWNKAAYIDSLTGGMTSAAFRFTIKSVIEKSAPNTYAIVMLHIKDFKLINELFGVEYGDKVLKHIMGILQAEIRKDEFVARSFADNFFLCLKENESEKIKAIIKRICDRIEEDYIRAQASRNLPYSCIIQSGVYVVDDTMIEATVMQDRARTACRKRTSFEDGMCLFYDWTLTEKIAYEQELNSLFESSLENGDFKVYLQPKVDLKTETVLGAEALVRWQHPDKGLISPAEFIPLFEKNGKICALDLYIFEETCKVLKHWQEQGRLQFPVSVNLSRQHLRRGDFWERFLEIVDRYEIPTKFIEFELTESIFFDEKTIKKTQEAIKEFHRLGFLFSIDDFGSGYSSFGLLMRFDVDTIKFDQSFFTDIKNTKSRTMLKALVEIVHGIGATAVAEGIETPEQLDFVKSIDCDMVQGYIYSKPLPVSEFEDRTWRQGTGDALKHHG